MAMMGIEWKTTPGLKRSFMFLNWITVTSASNVLNTSTSLFVKKLTLCRLLLSALPSDALSRSNNTEYGCPSRFLIKTIEDV
jgi:hypothetical protein